MTMTVRESFERGTEAFNAHDIVGFAEVLADDAVFEARQAGCVGRERRPALSSMAAG